MANTYNEHAGVMTEYSSKDGHNAAKGNACSAYDVGHSNGTCAHSCRDQIQNRWTDRASSQEATVAHLLMAFFYITELVSFAILIVIANLAVDGWVKAAFAR